MLQNLRKFFNIKDNNNSPQVPAQLSGHKYGLCELGYRTHLQTDKNIYKPGETVYLRGWIAHVLTLAAYVEPSNTYLKPIVNVISPKGEKVLTETLQDAVNSVIWMTWTIPEDQPGGDYVFELSYPANNGMAFAQRKFNIRAFRPPRLKTHLEFLKKGYGAGDNAQAKLDVERAEGGYPANAKVSAIARIDGAEVFRKEFKLDDKGKCVVTFDLPKKIATGVGTLSCVITDGGVVETASKTIPIILQSIEVHVYPEGGDLVANVKNGLYISAFTPVGDPADITANIVSVDKKGHVKEVVGNITTEHEGRGKTIFIPREGEKYELKVTKPTGIINTIPLPEPVTNGVSIISSKKIYQHDEPIVVQLGSPTKQNVKVYLFRLNSMLDSKDVSFEVPNALLSVSLTPNAAYYGVLRVTVVLGDRPIAERIVFRQPKDIMKVEITTDRSSYTPASQASVKIKTTVNGQPVPAYVGVTVTDDSVRKMTEKRKQPPQMLPLVLLEDEVKDLDDAHVYFKFTDKKRAKAENALDLLLGTQGWRKFIYPRMDQEIDNDPKVHERLFGVHIATETAPTRNRFREVERFFANEDRMVFAEEREMALEKESVVFSAPVLAAPALAAPAPAIPALAPARDVAPARARDIAPPPARARDIAPAPVRELAPAPALAAPAFASEAAPAIHFGKRQEADMIMFEEERSVHADEDMFLGDIAPIDNTKYFERVYAHSRPYTSLDPSERTDFTETLYWNAEIQTNSEGEAQVSFQLNDSVTSFAVLVDGISFTRVLGQALFVFESKQPFYLEPKLPLEVTSGDVIELPIAIVNNTDQHLSLARELTTTSSAILVKDKSAKVDISADGRTREVTVLEVGDGKPGEAKVTISAIAPTHKDNVTRTTKVIPKGFPYRLNAAGLLQENLAFEHKFNIPEFTYMSSIVTTGQIYATPMGNMTEVLKKLIQEPCGCFEQTSSTVYPLTMAQKYFQTHKDVDPVLIKRSDEILTKGYKRLVGFECKDGGYDWFGSSPASEPLTSFGILEFTEMSKVMKGVDPAMLQRCYDWLMTRRDGKGSFKVNPRVLHTWSTEALMSDTYILYSLTKAGFPAAKIEPELKFLKERLDKEEDTYLLALYANILFYIEDTTRFNKVLDKLGAMQNKDGTLPEPKTTVTHSGGKSKQIETISFAMLAWLLSNNSTHTSRAIAGAKYLFDNCELDGWCNTQATVLAIEAIVQYDIKTAKPKKPGKIEVLVEGDVIQTIEINEHSPAAIDIADFSEAISLAGPHVITVRQQGGSDMNYTFGITFHADRGDSSEECSVHIDQLALRNTTIAEGEGTEVAVKIRNKTNTPLPMTMLIVGLPGGLELRHEKMKELVKSEKIAAYELLGARRVACYFRQLQPKEEIAFDIDVIAAVPGTYTGPASAAYLYYTKEYKHWMAGLNVKITPRA